MPTPRKPPVSDGSTPTPPDSDAGPPTPSDSGPAGDTESTASGAPPEDGAAAGDIHVVDKRWWARGDGDDDDTAGAASDKPAFVEDLQRQLVEKDELLRSYAEKYTAQVSEFDATRARLRREVAKDVEREKRAILESFLEVIDNLDRAIEAGRETAADSALLSGVELVQGLFLSTLERHGVTRSESAGQTFDPTLHDALATVQVTEPDKDGVVVEVIKPGYALADEVLRPASVAVGKVQS